MSTEAFAASSSLALSTWPLYAATRDVLTALRAHGAHGHTPAVVAFLLAKSAAVDVLASDVHGRALRQEKGDDRRVVVGCCLVQATPVAAQMAPHGRCRRRGARRNEAEMKFLSFLDLYVLFIFIFFKSKSATYGYYIELIC